MHPVVTHPSQGRVIIPRFVPFSDSKKHTDENGCFSTEKNLGKSCRQQSNARLPVGMNFYDVNSTFKSGSGGRGKNTSRVDITAGGPGSNKGLCCGITTSIIEGRNGRPYFRIATEDWLHNDAYEHGKMQLLCSNKPGGETDGATGQRVPNCGGTIDAPSNIEDQQEVPFSWHAQHNTDNSYTYCGKLGDNSSGCVDANGMLLPNVLGAV
jgi:hypothetical protein